MNRVLVPLLLFSGECLAHPGHGAPLIHVHEWDWAHLSLGIGMVVVAAIAIWREK
jgi:hypothetical protein